MSRHLNAAQLAQLETDLLQRRYALVQTMQSQLGELTRAEHAREQLRQEADGESGPDANPMVDLVRSDIHLEGLRQIDEALKRLRRADYGVCRSCSLLIPFERLQHSPESMRCSSCQTALEKKANTLHART